MKVHLSTLKPKPKPTEIMYPGRLQDSRDPVASRCSRCLLRNTVRRLVPELLNSPSSLFVDVAEIDQSSCLGNHLDHPVNRLQLQGLSARNHFLSCTPPFSKSPISTSEPELFRRLVVYVKTFLSDHLLILKSFISG